MVRDDIKNSSLLKTKFLIYAFNGRAIFYADALCTTTQLPCLKLFLRSLFYADALCITTQLPCLKVFLRSLLYADALCATTQVPCI